MRKSHRNATWSTFGLLVCIVGVWLWWDSGGTQARATSTIDPDETQAPSRGIEVDGQPQSKAGATSSGENATGTSSSSRKPMPRDMDVQIIGRCVDADGNPVPDCEVQLSVGRPKSKRRSRPGGERIEPRSIHVEPQRTGTDGRFAFHFESLPRRIYTLSFTADRFAWSSGRIPGPKDGEVLDLGEIRLLPGVRIQGRVVDDKGLAVSAYPMRLAMNYEHFRIGSPKLVCQPPRESWLPRGRVNEPSQGA